MACRIQNTGAHRLALNLRGGEVLYLEPQEISRPLREEALYDNMYLDDWRQRGLVRWIDVKMSEVLSAEGAAPDQADDGKPAPEQDDAAASASGAASAKAAPKGAAAKKAPR